MRATRSSALVWLAATAIASAMAWPRGARAEGAANEAPAAPWENAPPTRRGGFMTSVDVGGGVAGVAGFPNDVHKIGLARYYTSTGVIPGAAGTLWIGGALTDYFNFGLGLTSSQLFASGDKISK